jgi:hypothetical protein
MTVQQLLNDLTDAAGSNGSQSTVEFSAMFDVGAVSSDDDQMKQVSLSFKECMVSSNHPTKIKITLV